MMFDAVTTMTEQVKAGKVRAIVTSGKQCPVLPMYHAQRAGVPGYGQRSGGLLAQNTPKAVTDKLNEAVSKFPASRGSQLWANRAQCPW